MVTANEGETFERRIFNNEEHGSTARNSICSLSPHRITGFRDENHTADVRVVCIEKSRGRNPVQHEVNNNLRLVSATAVTSLDVIR